MSVGWIIMALVAVPLVTVATYAELQERRDRREILLHGESALGKP